MLYTFEKQLYLIIYMSLYIPVIIKIDSAHKLFISDNCTIIIFHEIKKRLPK